MKHLILLLMAFTPAAYGDPHHDAVNGTNGVDGKNGIDGLNSSRFNDTQLNRALSISAAMSSIPVQSHIDEHNHTSAGMALGGYSSEVGVAIGINHMQDQMSYRSSIGKSGSETMYSIGAGYTW